MKQPLMVIPGLLCTAALWERQRAGLEDICDIRIADHTRHDSVGAIAAALLDEMPATFALAGLSMGGYIAMEILRQAPQRVSRLALLDTAPGADDEARKELRRQFVALARKAGIGPVIDRLMPQFLSEKHCKDAAMAALVRKMAEDTGTEAFARQQEAIMGRPDSTALLGEIRCPSLVLVGADDGLTPPDVARFMHERLQDSSLVVVPDCGHLSPIEQPDAVTQALRVWLQRPAA